MMEPVKTSHRKPATNETSIDQVKILFTWYGSAAWLTGLYRRYQQNDGRMEEIWAIYDQINDHYVAFEDIGHPPPDLWIALPEVPDPFKGVTSVDGLGVKRRRIEIAPFRVIDVFDRPENVRFNADRRFMIRVTDDVVLHIATEFADTEEEVQQIVQRY